VHDEAAVADKEAMDKRVTEEAAVKQAAEEATTKKAAEERAAEEAAVKKAAGERAAGAVGGSPAPGQAPSAAGAKRSAAPPRRPNIPIGVFGNLGFSSSLPFFPFFHSLTTLSV
jgi:zinc D-Ala-D-Ala carboxypeptidase